MKKLLALTIGLGLALSACDTTSPTSPVFEENPGAGIEAGPGFGSTLPTPIVGEWELVAFELSDGTTIPISEPEKYTANFTEDGEVNIRADCNLCFGNYETDNEKITFGPQGCTMAACVPGSHYDRYTRALGGSTSYLVNGDVLELHYSGGTLRFRRS
jgi:heat shock protein HslJ